MASRVARARRASSQPESPLAAFEQKLKFAPGALSKNVANLEGRSLGPQDAASIGALLEHKATLWAEVTLASNPRLGDDGAVKIAGGLSVNRTVRYLGLQNCEIGPAGCRALALGLEANGTLETLRLDENPIGFEGASALAAMLTKNVTLLRLTLFQCRLNADCGKVLASALERNSTLISLNVCDNRLAEAGVDAIGG
eukprot:tig00021680_g23049.t1